MFGSIIRMNNEDKNFGSLKGATMQDNAKKVDLQGRNFVITGTLKKFTRDEAHAAIKNRYGFMQTSIANNTDYLVIGGNALAGNRITAKAQAAEKLGVKVLTESQFIDMLDGKISYPKRNEALKEVAKHQGAGYCIKNTSGFTVGKVYKWYLNYGRRHFLDDNRQDIELENDVMFYTFFRDATKEEYEESLSKKYSFGDW